MISVDEKVETVLMMVMLVIITSLLCRRVPFVAVLLSLVSELLKTFKAVCPFWAPSRALFSRINLFLSIGRGSRHFVMMNVALS